MMAGMGERLGYIWTSPFVVIDCLFLDSLSLKMSEDTKCYGRNKVFFDSRQALARCLQGIVGLLPKNN